MLKKIKQYEWYRIIFAKFERKDFMQLILYVLIILGTHIITRLIKVVHITEEASTQFEGHITSFFSVLLCVIGIHYFVRTIGYLLKKDITKKEKEIDKNGTN
ncbi:MAG: hypothetical protein KKD48_04915 [Nanoarchaeota archaeon]|nr:hypothetical protein [Nanoarchaeota archaeon]